MAFPLKDVRFVTRRAGRTEPTVYPRLLRDRSILPKIDIAIQYFESMLGRERRELDTEVFVHFLGDYKLARCLVACLARSYRFRARRLDEVVTRTALRRLQRAEVDSPRGLRFRLYQHLNGFGHGFLRSAEREATYGQLETEFGLRRGELERLLYLDADEHAILARVGAEPEPASVAAQYNFGVLDSLLRHAEQVELAFGAPFEDPGALLELATANEVEAEITTAGRGRRLALRGRQDALGVWARHGRKVARTVVQVLERLRPLATDGSACISLRGRRASLRLTAEVLDILAGAPAPCSGLEASEQATRTALDEAAQALRSARDGWSVRRLPDPQASSAGVVVPDWLAGAHGERFHVCAVRSAGHARRLATIAASLTAGEPFVFVGPAAVLAPLSAVGARAIAIPRFEKTALVEGMRAHGAPQKPQAA